MSLLEEATTKCNIMYKRTSPDGYGGYNTKWIVGAEVKLAIVLNTSTEARTGEQQGVTATYTITMNKNTNLKYHDVVKRQTDGRIFRVTSDGDDKHTPGSACLNMRQVTAEEWKLNGEQVASD